jgi:tetratricopeptide (TPR) repeat protein
MAAMDKAAELNPDGHPRLYLAAPLHLQVGDRAGYRRICREMLERFGDTKDPGVAAQIVKTCLLVPGAVADLDGVLKLADRVVTGTEKDPSYRYYLFGKGLAEYRAGRYAEAVQWLERVAPKASGGEIDASAFAVLAMARQRQGQAEEARAALEQARAILAHKLPKLDKGEHFGNDWHDWLRFQILFREAEEMLKIKRSP